MRDKALEWLFANDPKAGETSRNRYKQSLGILGQPDWQLIRAHEVTTTDPTEAYHCEACRRKSMNMRESQRWEDVE